ncbi:ComEC/Rec2 family competence protein [Comamonas composti]|uniref:ComEC/Rec2 family competence protein n=1 Tax=Comamonas composti TaxID=408558 RepID=UPI000685C6B5|nr:ComEC/Rec2 family competence protein [Comamonas composti]
MAAALGAVAGAGWQVCQGGLWPAAAYLLQMLLGAGLLGGLVLRPWRHSGRAVQALCWALAAGLLVAGMSGWRAQSFAARILPAQLEGQDLQVQGLVASLPQVGEQGQRWRLAVEQVWRDGRSLPLAAFPELIDVAWYAPRASQAGALDAGAGHEELRPGQRWLFTLRLKRVHGARNPHGFDYELWQWEQGVQATGYVRERPPARLLASTPAYRVQRWRQQMRAAILAGSAGLQSWTGGDEARAARLLGVVAALAMGDQQAISRDDWALFRHTGVAHLMSISGLHITLFAWLAAQLLRRVWRLSARACLCCPAPLAALVGGVLLAAGYALFSGWGVPAQRTLCMLATVGLLRALGLRWPWPAVWCTALAVVVIADPWALWQAGFWLSFVAVGVLFATDGPGRDELRPALAHKAWRLWTEQARISTALAPLGLLLFGQMSLAGLLANLLAIPWVTLVVTPLALLGALCSPLWGAAALALVPLDGLLRLLDGWAWAVLYLPQPPLGISLVAIAGGLALVAPWPRTWRLWGLVLCLPALWWPLARPRLGEFELLAVDIGQGNAVLVRTAAHDLLYDAGPSHGAQSNAGERVILPLLQSLGVRLDALWLSHRDSDHTGAALALHASQPAAQVWGSDSVIGEPALAGLAPVRRCEAGQRWQWDGVEFEVLHPPAAWSPELGRPSSNAGSCVLRLRAGSGAVALMAGDLQAAQESALLRAGRLQPVDWLLVPHHGSRTSSSPGWVRALRPRWAVIQAGYRNRYGHPVAEVVQRYEDQGTAVVQSSRCGAAHWSSERPRDMGCERQLSARYWDLHRP